MRAFLIGLLCLFLWSTVARSIYVCILKKECPVHTTSVLPESNRLTNLLLIDGDTPILEGYEQFSFDTEKSIPNLSVDNKNYLNAAATYLKNNPDKNLKITGLYRPSEKTIHQGMFENLGLARANNIKNLLVQRGIDKSRLFLDYNIGDESLSEPLSFAMFSAIPEEMNDKEGMINAQYSFDNMVFSDANFEFNSAVFTPGSAFLNWADSVQVYLAEHPDQSLQIIGHTDNTGPAAYNEDLGLERALAARIFFKEKGIENKIRVISMGEKQPIASNATAEGEQRNRRVNFIIK